MDIIHKQLDDYLSHINNSGHITLGLDNWSHLAALIPVVVKPIVITVAGTNGKGSCIELISQALYDANISFAAYTSPHILDFKERLNVNNNLLSEEEWLNAFKWLDSVADVTLSPFEFYTLSALYLAYRIGVSVLLLEVGLGGRFDAVNVIDPDYSIITEIDYDHTDRLGSTLEEIAYQKAGIMRAGKPVVYAGLNVREEIISYAQDIGAKLVLADRARHFEKPIALPKTSGLAALSIADLLPFKLDMQASIKKFNLEGRFERVSYLQGEIIFDVAHNPSAMRNLADNLRSLDKTNVALWISLTKTKDIVGCVSSLREVVGVACVSKHSDILAHDCIDVRNQLCRFGVKVVKSDADYNQAQELVRYLQGLGYKIILVTGSFQHIGMVKNELGLFRGNGVRYDEEF